MPLSAGGEWPDPGSAASKFSNRTREVGRAAQAPRTAS